MIVVKYTWLDVGTGRPEEISKALQDVNLPGYAQAVEMSRDQNEVSQDGLTISFQNKTFIKFEWSSEE